MSNVIFKPGTVYFAGNARVGIPKEARVFNAYRQRGFFPDASEFENQVDPVRIEEAVYIGASVTIYEGTSLGSRTVLEDYVRIGFDCRVLNDVRLMYGAFVCDRVRIGSGTRIAGFVCDAAIIGSNCTVMGDLVHKYTVPDLAWGQVDEPSPIVADEAIIGYGSKIIGGVTIGSRSYIAAGAIVTKSVPANTVVTGTNSHTPIQDWRGIGLRDYFSRLRSKDNANS